MKRIGIAANCKKQRAGDVLARLGRKSADLNMALFSSESVIRLLGCGTILQDDKKMCDHVDAVMALGGDGTMLRAVRELDGADKPVIGVNLGGLGFLTSVAEEDIDKAMDCLARDDFETDTRSMIDSVILNGAVEKAKYRALNDVVVHSASSRIITLHVSINDEIVTSYVCDGLVVTTPTGSTGHSMSAGGPIVMPNAKVLVISLICPHTLSSRPLVVPDCSRICVEVGDDSGKVLLSADGQVGQALEPGDRVMMECSDKSIRFIHLPGYSYFSVLRQKLRWSGSSV